ncbi:MAG: TadE family protein [Verrucomicrobiota bacterium]
MLEFVIAFPIVLVLVFACIQFTHIWTARMVVHYAAFCAARSALVCHTDEYNTGKSAPSRAATTVCDLLQQPWGCASGSRNSTTVADDPKWNVTATHTYTLSLITPIVGQIIGWGVNPWDGTSPWSTLGKSSGNTDSLDYPTITLTETVVLPKPYTTMVRAGL